jgi:hypothetical protein
VSLSGRIDPYRCWQWRDRRRDVFESFGVPRKRIVEDALALREDLIGKVVVDRVRRQHRDTRRLVLEVVPGEEALAMPLSGADVGKPRRMTFNPFDMRHRAYCHWDL